VPTVLQVLLVLQVQLVTLLSEGTFPDHQVQWV
jgi:hypothetical protein